MNLIQNLHHIQTAHADPSTMTTSTASAVQPHEWKSFPKSKNCVISSFCSCITPVSKGQAGMDPKDSTNPFETHPQRL